jgi:4-hydroxythreonine-4-phosphate dehydrogenase
MAKKKIAITMGDHGGIGPEVIVKALFNSNIRDNYHPVVIGDAEIIREALRLSDLPLKVRNVNGITESELDTGSIDVLEIKPLLSFEKGSPSKNAGESAVKYIKKAVELALQKQVDAIVTAPLSKKSLRMADFSWPGHTELIAELTKTENFAMMFVSNKLKIILSTIHIPIKDVPKNINEKVILNAIKLAKKASIMCGIRSPRIAVAGLNPHAGESGIMGDEEIKVLAPAINEAEALGIEVSGPHPPDVVFYKTLKGEFDMVVCMYHDQGLIPFKMLAFDTGVNMTVGLPIIRTSPDHGTAFDIAWQDKANPASMVEAIKLAAKIELSEC